MYVLIFNFLQTTWQRYINKKRKMAKNLTLPYWDFWTKLSSQRFQFWGRLDQFKKSGLYKKEWSGGTVDWPSTFSILIDIHIEWPLNYLGVGSLFINEIFNFFFLILPICDNRSLSKWHTPRQHNSPHRSGSGARIKKSKGTIFCTLEGLNAFEFVIQA